MTYQKSDGLNYAPKGKSKPVCERGEFVFAATALDHGHIFGMTNGLIEAGGVCKAVYDPDIKRAEEYAKRYPGVKIYDSLERILEDKQINMVAGAAVTNKRCDLGLKVMAAGKDYFTDKAPLTTLEQLENAKNAVENTGRKYMTYYSERLHVEGAVLAGQLVMDGAIGDVIEVVCLAPHRLNAPSRPDWFWSRERSGGTLCDLGSHQIEQFLYYTKNKKASVTSARLANYNNHGHPDFDDFGSANLLGENGATQFLRVDWFTPDGLSTWGDGRLFLLGTKGYIEVRKYLDVARNTVGDNVYIVDAQGERVINANGTVGFPFFGEMILDSLERTERAMTQEHIFLAAELGVRAQMIAADLTPEVR